MNVKGHLTLSAFQLQGGSGTDFRQYFISEIDNLVILDEKFDGPRPGYNRNDHIIVSVIAAL
jgi:hypothetical protein